MKHIEVTQITRTRGTERILEDLEKLEAEKTKRLARLSELKDRQSKTFAEIAKLLSGSMSIDSLLRLNNTNSYHKSFEQSGEMFRRSVTRLSKAAKVEEEEAEEPKVKGRKRKAGKKAA